MKWWKFGQGDKQQLRLIAMMESGQLVDELADVTQTQVNARTAEAAVRNREAAPLYRQTQEGSPPAFYGRAIVETGYERDPDHDSQYVNDDLPVLFEGIRTGAVEAVRDKNMQKNAMVIVTNICGVIALIGLLWLAGRNIAANAERDLTAVAADQEVAGIATTTDEHGPVDGPLPGRGAQSAGDVPSDTVSAAGRGDGGEGAGADGPGPPGGEAPAESGPESPGPSTPVAAEQEEPESATTTTDHGPIAGPLPRPGDGAEGAGTDGPAGPGREAPAESGPERSGQGGP